MPKAYSKPLRVFITGMSGTGKSTVIEKLGEIGYAAVDTDSDDWSEWETLPDGSRDWVLREDAMRELLENHRQGALFVAGCKSNQGRFRDMFDRIVLLAAPTDVLLARVENRKNNDYGKKPGEREQILRYIEEVEPLLRAAATDVIDASLPLSEVVKLLEGLVLT